MACIGFLFILFFQQGAPPGAVNQARQPYVIQLRDGSERVGFWEEKQEQSRGKVRVELDKPWLPTPQWEMIARQNVLSAVEERPSITAARRKKGYADAGYIQLSDTLAVLKDDYDWALRARQMAGIDAPESPNDAQPEAPAAETMPAGAVATQPGGEGPPLPGFFDQWGAHIGLILVAVLLTGLVVRMTFLATE